jgi:cell wall assembly regulator SMI1
MEKFEEAEQGLTIEDLQAFAAEWEITLPKEFIELYLQSNGGYPPFDAVEGDEYVYNIDWFLPIKYGELTIDRLLRENRNEGLDMKGMIPFAADSHDNLFVLSVAPADYGSIYLFGREDDPGESSSYSFVCSSFTDFITGLTNEYQDE